MAKTDTERGPIGAWMRRERVAHHWTTKDVVDRLAERNVPILEASYRGYEAGPSRPSAQVRQALEAVFGSSAPDTTKEATEPQQLDSLIVAMAAQTEAINRLVDVLALNALAVSDRPDRLEDQLVQAGLLPAEESNGESIEHQDGEDKGQPPSGSQASK